MPVCAVIGTSTRCVRCTACCFGWEYAWEEDREGQTAHGQTGTDYADVRFNHRPEGRQNIVLNQCQGLPSM